MHTTAFLETSLVLLLVTFLGVLTGAAVRAGDPDRQSWSRAFALGRGRSLDRHRKNVASNCRAVRQIPMFGHAGMRPSLTARPRALMRGSESYRQGHAL
jgi:hypothetical protein